MWRYRLNINAGAAGGASRVTGIVDDMSPLDPVNRKQLNMAYGGIASVSALAVLLSTAPNQHLSI